MNRRAFLKNASAAALVLGLGGCLKTSPALGGGRRAARPNIILCMTDDQGWGDVGYNGLTQIKTPALDAMAAGGLRLDRFYSAHPSCTPTRASVLTGRHPNRMGAFWPGMPLRKQEMTIAQAVKRAGYTTAHFGKWHMSGGAPGKGRPLESSDPLHPGQFGFDEWFTVSNWFDTDWTFSRNGKPVKVTGDGSDAIVSEALKFIDKNAKEDKPFLALIWFGSPHVPLKPTAEDLKAAGGSAYYGEMVGVDRAMGTLRSGLRKLGVSDNTMLWFNSDNGAWVEDGAAPDAYGSNGSFHGHKGELWEGGVRVPGLIEWPSRIRQPWATSVPVSTSDIYPTIVDLLKINIPDQVLPIDGVSIMPLIDGQMKVRPKPMGFWSYDDKCGKCVADAGPSAWTDNRYKLIKHSPEKIELYDLLSDPQEKTDLAGKYPELVARMRSELEVWLQSVTRSYGGADYKR